MWSNITIHLKTCIGPPGESKSIIHSPLRSVSALHQLLREIIPVGFNSFLTETSCCWKWCWWEQQDWTTTASWEMLKCSAELWRSAESDNNYLWVCHYKQSFSHYTQYLIYCKYEIWIIAAFFFLITRTEASLLNILDFIFDIDTVCTFYCIYF